MRPVCLALVMMALAGCTIGGENPPNPPAGTTTSPPAPSGSVGAAQASPAATHLPVIESRKASIRGNDATIALNEVVVADGLTTVTWTVTNDEAGSRMLQLTLVVPSGQSVFSDGRTGAVPGSGTEVEGDLSAVDGVFLIDAVNRLRYLPARDAQGTCACSRTERYETIAGGQSRSFSAVFRAIPAGVDTVGVSIPLAGTFSRVAVQR